MMTSVLMSGLLVLIRTTSFVTFLPPVAGKNIPPQVKVVIAVALSLCWWNRAMFATAVATTGSIPLPAFALLGVIESVIGVGLAWLCSSLISLASTAGTLLADGLGLNMESVSSVLETGSGTSLSLLMETLLAMLLFTLNLHHAFLALLNWSFDVFPVGRIPSIAGAERFIAWYAAIGTAPVGLVLPVLLVTSGGLMIISVSMRQASQFNLLSYGMPLRLLLGMTALVVLFPSVMLRMSNLVRHLVDQLLVHS